MQICLYLFIIIIFVSIEIIDDNLRSLEVVFKKNRHCFLTENSNTGGIV